MKKLIFITCCLFLSFSIAAQKDNKQNQDLANPTYCAMIRDGVMKVHLEGSYLVSDVTLSNGTVITTDGNLIKREGDHIVLQNGECVDTTGNVINPSGGYKTEKTYIIKQAKKK
ncbi:MAG TPA: DUF6799 domain-containing protein [Saprospiraceae bacterium]|nr:DUF6799 domain-containing protein [Saprospiraceae bacterium]